LNLKKLAFKKISLGAVVRKDSESSSNVLSGP
jgi:hypothetical protein